MNELLRKARGIQDAYDHLRATGQGLKANLPVHTGLAYRTCCRYLRLLEYAEEESDPELLRAYWAALHGRGNKPAQRYRETPPETPSDTLDIASGILFRAIDVLCLMTAGAFTWDLLKLVVQ